MKDRTANLEINLPINTISIWENEGGSTNIRKKYLIQENKNKSHTLKKENNTKQIK